LKNAEEFFLSFYKSGVRIGGLLRAREQHTVEKIIAALEDKIKIFEKNGHLKLPIPVLICKGKKN
jgi:hypothetical protein